MPPLEHPSAALPTPAPTRGGGRGAGREAASGSYAALLRTVRDAGLLRRTLWFYGWTAGVLTLALAGVGKDPDIAMDAISFLPEQAAGRRGLGGAWTRRQGWLFFPLLTLEGLNLHVTSVRTLVADRREGWVRELVTIVARLGVYLGLVLWLLPPGKAASFVGVHLAVFGVYMGASFAPNHKRMAIVPERTTLDFLSRQVLTSRNLVGGRLVGNRFLTAAYGGLNHQVEHHLFPSMPRPHLARARAIVREHCRTLGLPYTETTALQSYGIVVRYLKQVGLHARDPFDCPTFRTLRRQ